MCVCQINDFFNSERFYSLRHEIISLYDGHKYILTLALNQFTVSNT